MQYDPANPAEYACFILMREARVDHWPWDEGARQRVLRAARRATHPDLNGGDRSRWDQVDWAVAVLGLQESRATSAL